MLTTQLTIFRFLHNTRYAHEWVIYKDKLWWYFLSYFTGFAGCTYITSQAAIHQKMPFFAMCLGNSARSFDYNVTRMTWPPSHRSKSMKCGFLAPFREAHIMCGISGEWWISLKGQNCHWPFFAIPHTPQECRELCHY